MKKFNKNTAIILSILMFVVLAIGFVFSYVPIQFSKTKFVSLSKTTNISTDLVGGMYGEYNITTENPTEKDIVDSVSLIREVFEDDGYKNVNVYAVGGKKIRIELSYPNGDETYGTTYTKLSNVGAGAFSISTVNPSASTETTETKEVTLEGHKYVKEVNVFTQDDGKYISVVFTKDGKDKFKEVCDNSTSSQIYMILGTYSQAISIGGIEDYSNFTLSNTDWKNTVELEQKIRLGCAKVELDGTNAIINTMSATLTSGEAASSSAEKSFFSSTIYVIAFSSLILIAVIMIAVFAIKFGFFALIALISMLFASYLYLFIVWLVPSFELGLSVIFSLVVGIALIYTYAFKFAQNVKNEYNLGKSLQAALESSYKKSVIGEVITNVMLFLASLVLMALSFGELTSVAISFAILSALSIFTNLCVIPLLVKIGISFKGFDRKLFLLKKRKGLIDLDDDQTEEEGK
ncbi:MAG: hypothetical protein IKJ33_03375 [Clostridia bacterium]|nr:hypothetical protein [Clostridia bacterium]